MYMESLCTFCGIFCNPIITQKFQLTKKINLKLHVYVKYIIIWIHIPLNTFHLKLLKSLNINFQFVEVCR